MSVQVMVVPVLVMGVFAGYSFCDDVVRFEGLGFSWYNKC
ncbi:hypothetical protein T03_12352 [Trichinella britovi]|uniref:Uncharacterized protein n=1 Tax=Trichinella britovi TaxID=45882 RepID=A0A0V0YTZ9_TRIBR|nr:hypothetical protein T03_12352 [Trichinella britovi]